MAKKKKKIIGQMQVWCFIYHCFFLTSVVVKTTVWSLEPCMGRGPGPWPSAPPSPAS